MKKFVTIIAIAALVLQLTACSGGGIDTNDNRESADNDGRTELIMATDGRSSGLSCIVNSFNSNSKDYKIKMVRYGTKEKNISHLRTEIIAGNPPDIYALSQNWFADVELPMYEDLILYLDNDPIYSREAFVPGLFDAITSDGSLYYIPYEFYVETFTAPESVVGVRSGITMEEAEKFAKELGPDVGVFPAWMSRETLLPHIVMFSRAKFIDPNTGECDFLNPEFIELLEKCKAHPYSTSEYSFGSNLLENSLLQSFAAFGGLHNGYGTDYSFVGFPTQDSNGSTFGIQLRFSISSNCQHKDAAWEFIRTIMSEENQKNVQFFPVIQSELDRQIESVLQEDSDITQVKLEQFEVDRLVNLINFTNMISDGADVTIRNIITEETAAFFAGDKTAEEVAKLIQSRVSIYVEEKK